MKQNSKQKRQTWEGILQLALITCVCLVVLAIGLDTGIFDLILFPAGILVATLSCTPIMLLCVWKDVVKTKIPFMVAWIITILILAPTFVWFLMSVH